MPAIYTKGQIMSTSSDIFVMYYAVKQTLHNSRGWGLKRQIHFNESRSEGLCFIIKIFLWSLPWRTNNSCAFIRRKLTRLQLSWGCDLSFQKRNVTTTMSPQTVRAEQHHIRGVRADREESDYTSPSCSLSELYNYTGRRVTAFLKTKAAPNQMQWRNV